MNFNSIEGLNAEQINELYENIAVNEFDKLSTGYLKWSVRCYETSDIMYDEIRNVPVYTYFRSQCSALNKCWNFRTLEGGDNSIEYKNCRRGGITVRTCMVECHDP